MLAFVVTLRGGRRYTVRASEVRPNGGCLELWVRTFAHGNPDPQLVALFDLQDVQAVVATEFLVSEEPCEPRPHVAGPNDPIPF